MQEHELRDLYTQFMDHNIRASAGRHFEVAYHALAAAMHCAEDIRDAGLLAEVQRRAEEQRQWIDTKAPAHKLSSPSAKTRGNESVFTSLVKQIHSMLLGLKVDEQAEEVRQLNEKTGDGGLTS